MKKAKLNRMRLHRETLRELQAAVLEGRELRAPAGGAWPQTTVNPYPCQPWCQP